MTTEHHHEEMTSDGLLERLYNVAVSIEQKVEEIFEGLQDLIDTEQDRTYRGYDWRHEYDENNHN